MTLIFRLTTLSLMWLGYYSAKEASDLCPDPHRQGDAADAPNTRHVRPPPGFHSVNVTGVGPYSINISWEKPTFTFTSGQTLHICHYHIKVKFLPPQKGSHERTIAMNIRPNATAAALDSVGLTPNTSVTLLLSSCLLMPNTAAQSSGFICTEPNVITQRTDNKPDDCPDGAYMDANLGTCKPCQCHDNSLLCESGTGKCLDCLNNTQGDFCDECIKGYNKTADGCTQPSAASGILTDSPTTPKSTTVSQTPTTVKNTLANSCGPGDCRNGGTCRQTGYGRSCICDHRFTGEYCEKVINSTAVDRQPESDDTTLSPPIKPTSNDYYVNGHLMTIIIVLVIVLLVAVCCAALLIYRRYRMCKKTPTRLWTLQLQNDNQATVAFSDILEPHVVSREDNKLIENDFNSHHNRRNSFANDENPYKTLTA